MDKGGRALSKLEGLPEVGHRPAERSVVGMLHAVAELHAVSLGRGTHPNTVREKPGGVQARAAGEGFKGAIDCVGRDGLAQKA